MHASTQSRAAPVSHALKRVFEIPRDARWHLSPGIDVAGYAFSWVFIALPVIFFLAPDTTGLLVAFATGSFIDTHRHYTFSFVYLDGEVRRRHPVRFLLLPAVCLVLWTQTPALARSVETVGVPQAGAFAAWLWLTIQILWQDQGGAFQGRTAIPLFLGSATAGMLLAAVESDPARIGWIWLALGMTASLLLHVLVSRDASAAGRRTHWVFPAVALGVAGLAAISAQSAARFPLRAPASLLLLTFVVWQTYHVMMQKYGILRVYSAKSGQPEKIPGWVDRLLILGVVPAFVVWLGNSQLQSLVRSLVGGNEDVAAVLVPPLRLIGQQFSVLMALGCAFWAGSIATFAWHEWRVHQLRNAPRLWFAAGTTLLYLAVFQLGLTQAYIVFASSHGLEYIVFIWGYQRRRYRDEATREAASPLLRHPVFFYLGFTALIMGALFYANYSYEFASLASLPRVIFGEDAHEWLIWFTLYHGVLHFYYDGFLWKLRRPALRAQL